MNNRTKRDRLSAIAIIAILILLVVNAYLMYDKFNNDKIIEQQNQELKEANQLKDDLEEEYYEAISELEGLKTDNEDLNQLIEEQKNKLKDQKDQIDNLLVDKRNLAAARVKLNELKNNIDDYLIEIERLTAENQALNADNQNLKQENQLLTNKVNEERNQRTALEEEKEDLLTDQERLKQKQEEMLKKINRASVIEVGDLIVEGFKMNDNGKLRSRRRARNIDLLKVCFTTSSNPVAQSGKETFHLRIINPIGETIAVETMGSGVIQSQVNQELIRFTTFTEVDYRQEPEQYCLDWKPLTPFMEGLYEIELYNKGYRAGKTTFEMR